MSRKKPTRIEDMEALVSEIGSLTTMLEKILIEVEEGFRDEGIELFLFIGKPIAEMGISEKVKVAKMIINLGVFFKREQDVPHSH